MNTQNANNEVTKLELQVLTNIFRSEYQSVNSAEEAIGQPVWTSEATNDKKDLAGALGSCVKKGLAGVQEYSKSETNCWITAQGAAVLNANNVIL